MATVKENLIAARKLIDTPEKWIKGEYGDSLKGCFCALGSLREVIGDAEGDWTPEAKALSEALPESKWSMVHEFNDAIETTHADMMALFDRAIEAAE